MYMGKLKRGQPYAIEFTADAANAGTTFVGYFWHPVSGPPTAVTSALVAAGASQTIGSGTVPTNAKILEINVRPPNGGGGQLRVTQDPKVVDKPPVSGETNWIFDVKDSK